VDVLVVGGDVTGATSLVGQLAVLERQLKSTIKLASDHPGGSGGGIDGGDGESARGRGRTLSVGGGLGVGSNGSREAGSDKGLHFRIVGWWLILM